MKKIHVTAICCAAMMAAMMVPVRAKAQGASDDDKKFLALAAQGDQNEIAVSQVAEQKATNPAVKAFAKKMVTEHKAMTASMKPFAEKWGITPPMGPDADHQKEIDKLKEMNGADFDKRYISDMVDDHGTALDKFTSEAKDTKDKAFQRAVIGGKTKVAAHKNMAYDLKKKL
ncbi:MAG TPA: DUF4142 domain-containing protein [Acidobacteriaceae bacterium]